ncbi:MAG: radical SAM protein [Candidatus Omnitrophica bacterium]|nr:radical SAM protein [Candidatus Omnitrophota bacterium]
MELNQFPLRIEITNKCNLKCDYCLSLTSCYYRNRPETDFAAVKKFIKFLKIRALFLLGGEVCFYHKMKELAKYCLDHKVGIGIVTNGTILDKYKELSKINKNISYLVSYNEEGHPRRLELCDKFIKEMNVNSINILVNKNNLNTIIKRVERFHRLKKIRLIKIFSDERTNKGSYDRLFESLASKYKKVYIHDYSLMKGCLEKVEDIKGLRVRCDNPLSLKGNSISFCKNIEYFGMDITEIDFSKKYNRDRLKDKFLRFQKTINSGKVRYCKRCRFKSYITRDELVAQWVINNLRKHKKYQILKKMFNRKARWAC